MAVHYIVTMRDVKDASDEGRQWYSMTGDILGSIELIRLALRLDGEVWSR